MGCCNGRCKGSKAPQRHSHVPLRVTRLAVQRGKADAARYSMQAVVGQPVVECLVADGGEGRVG